jgi:hypothetical protein
MPLVGKDVADFEIEEILVFLDSECTTSVVKSPQLVGDVWVAFLFDHLGVCEICLIWMRSAKINQRIL